MKRKRRQNNKPIVKVPATLPERLVLVYAGTFVAFRMKEFTDWVDLAKFVARNSLKRDDFAIIQGKIEKAPKQYIDPKRNLYTDAGNELESAESDT